LRAAVLSIGAEILRGDILDTNAPYLARELAQLGFDVRRMGQTGDVLDELTLEISASLAQADVLLCTGGLGPTQDDVTRQGVAAALGEEITIDEGLVDEIATRFQSLRRSMPERNRQQAQVIPSASVLHNPNGTAPGWYVQRDGKVVATMPGPPKEMQPMWRDLVRPRLETLLPGFRAERALMTFGVGESRVEQLIDDVIAWRDDVTVATYAKEAGVQVHITARAPAQAEAASLADEAEARVCRILGSAVFGKGDTSLSVEVGRLLRDRGMTLAVMESATGGQLANAITDVDGSSEYFSGGVVAYTRDTKARHGVSNSVMRDKGLISAETASSMAEAARTALQSDVGIGTTGVAGGDPVEGRPPGTCFVAVALNGVTEVREVHRTGSREMSKRYFSHCALDLLRRQLTGVGDS
jgi:nicotinamide-nucleotide amidase